MGIGDSITSEGPIMQDIEIALTQIKSSIEDLGQRVVRCTIQPSLPKDFKLVLDDLRLTIWAVIMAGEEASNRAEGVNFGLSSKLVEFRIKRLLQMLGDLEADVQNGNVSPSHPELHKLVSALEESTKNLTKFCTKVSG